MKAIQRLVQYCLIVAVLLATVGFKVNGHYCPITKQRTTYFFSQPECCCGVAFNSNEIKKPCCSNLFSYHKADFQSIEKGTKQTAIFKCLAVKPATQYFQIFIRPLSLAKEPFYTLPTPRSGRTITILHQIFIV